MQSLNWRDWLVPHHSSLEVLEELAERFDYHNDDILVTTYPKCGTTLTQEIVSCLVLGLDHTSSVDLKLRSPFLDLSPPPGLPKPLDAAKQLPRPRIMKTHLPPAYHARHMSASSSGPRNIVVMRNPKDATVSAFHHMTAGMRPLPGVADNFAQFWRHFLTSTSGGADDDRSTAVKVHNFFDFSLSWWSLRRHPRVLVLFYEDLLRDKLIQVRRLAEFLDVSLTEELLSGILEATSFATMRENPNVNISLSDPGHWRPGTSFIRKGEVGDWKNHFTVADCQLVDQLIADRLAGSGLTFQYE